VFSRAKIPNGRSSAPRTTTYRPQKPPTQGVHTNNDMDWDFAQALKEPLDAPEECFRLEILECRRSLGEDVIGQTDFADSSRHCNGPDQRAEY
jgi:hypothetical protein